MLRTEPSMTALLNETYSSCPLWVLQFGFKDLVHKLFDYSSDYPCLKKQIKLSYLNLKKLIKTHDNS